MRAYCLASVNRVLRIASVPFDQERYHYFAGPLVLAGVLMIAGNLYPLVGGVLLSLGIADHLLVGRDQSDAGDQSTEAK